MQKPKVKDYLDCYHYLQDIYQFSKLTIPDFSYQTWCEDLNVKSKSYLRFATLGKRKISTELCRKFVIWLNLDGIDSEFFILLVEYSQCVLPEIKKTLSQKMLQHIRQDQSNFNIKTEKLSVTNPLFLQIRDLLSFTDQCFSILSLSRIFKKSEIEIQTALDYLKKIKWIEQQQPNGTWSASDQSIRIEDEHGNSVLQKFHENSLREAILHLNTDDLNRKFRCLHLALSEDEFSEFHLKISDYMTQLFNDYSSSKNAIGKKIFQINYNISPRTQIIEDESSFSKKAQPLQMTAKLR